MDGGKISTVSTARAIRMETKREGFEARGNVRWQMTVTKKKMLLQNRLVDGGTNNQS